MEGALMKSDQKVFLSVRTDGLGARLRSLLNASYLAKRHGVHYRFIWTKNNDKSHAIYSADKTFASEYLSHHLSEPTRDGYLELPPGLHSAQGVSQTLDASDRGVIVHYDTLPLHMVDDDSDQLVGFRGLFDQIGFQSRYKRLIAATYEITLPENPIALHHRTGDIVYGSYRYMSNYNRKALPVPIAKQEILSLMDSGSNPIIFGQDEPTCKHLAASGARACLLAQDLIHFVPRDDRLGVALCEVVLMSRCREIRAGSSAFAELAAMIGGIEIVDPRSGMDDRESVEMLVGAVERGDLSQLHPLQISYAIFSAVHLGRNVLSVARRIELMNSALVHDAKNPFYWILLMSLLLADDRMDAAREAAAACVTHCFDSENVFMSSLYLAISKSVGKAKSPLAMYKTRVRMVANQHRGAASFIMALYSLAEKDIKRAKQHLEAAYTSVEMRGHVDRMNAALAAVSVSP
ncbi:hypothetical protein [Hansschlegelia zhihuaiae]|uniref:Uncharacterized protein n=1 Tax=Hansschlegelia zhihuaiae TaxID=405005 RepID=A0A4Q0MKZ1_9HYPH|nr:hypothetical protein [Hansschlegelia zhihuaiae]RXF74457.1 hypothetical protein EK403_06525 [Hansschlegelia zhihuaiae]